MKEKNLANSQDLLSLSPFFTLDLEVLFNCLPSFWSLLMNEKIGGLAFSPHHSVGQQKQLHSEMVGSESFGHWRRISLGNARVASILNTSYEWGLPVFKFYVSTFKPTIVKPHLTSLYDPNLKPWDFLEILPGKKNTVLRQTLTCI